MSLFNGLQGKYTNNMQIILTILLDLLVSIATKELHITNYIFPLQRILRILQIQQKQNIHCQDSQLEIGNH
jgi:hypothetical protein